MTKYNFISIFIFILLCFAYDNLLAQKDTSKKNSITIISAFKPVVRNAVKINFSATHLNADTTRPVLDYQIPAQNLFYAYEPIPLKPLALIQDSSIHLGVRNFVKLGYGNYNTPYVSAGLGIGDGVKYLANFYANYIAGKGQIKNQQYGLLNLKLAGSYFLPKAEVYGVVNFSKNDYHLYGYNHLLYNYAKDDVKQYFTDFSIIAGLRNTILGEYGIRYNPTITVNYFNLKSNVNETSIIINAPIEKKISNSFALNIALNADLTKYETKGYIPFNANISNQVFQIKPSVIFATEKALVNAGIAPTWDNNQFQFLPNVYAQVSIADKKLMLQAGWVGALIKNTFKNLSEINPYLEPVFKQANTKEIEYYGGIKGTLIDHFNYNAKVGWVTYNNLPFFINDTAFDNKSFVISNETNANNLRMHADVSYVNKTNFSLTAGLTFNGYVSLKNNAKAWNTVPMEFTTALRWYPIKQLLVKADFAAFGAGFYLQKGNLAKAFNPGSDFSVGTEFKVTKLISLWIDVNNILNTKYERWHNYETLGLNVMGGVKINF